MKARKVRTATGAVRYACPKCGLSFGYEESASRCCSAVRFDNVIPIKGHRTPEQIQAQLEARYAEMAAVYNSPVMQFPCSTCR